MEYCVIRNPVASHLFVYKHTYLFFLILALGAILPATGYAATQVSQFGITWKFNQDYTVGQFANGDYYVIGPVTIISITPSSVSSSGRIKNGSMINPAPQSSTSRQGYDNAMAGNTYDSTLNKAFNVSTSKPLTVPAGSSIVSTVSVTQAGNCPQLQTAAILTVLAAVPPAGSFRPPYSGTDKTIRYNKSQLKYSLLENFAPVSYTPTLATIEQEFERPWIDHRGTAGGRYYHPADNMPDYGRDMSRAIGDAALMLHLNFTNQQKEKLLIRFVQLGIDLYGIVAAGGTENWEPDGGHASGRKWPIMFAGLMLGDTKMSSIGSIPFDQLYFGEDGQTFYVSQADVSLASTITNYDGVRYYGHFYAAGAGAKEYMEYTTGDLGMPEWGVRHAIYPLSDGKDWSNAAYRECCTANVWGGFVLAAHIMGQKDAWNHDALFDYMDRYMAIEAVSGYNRQQSQFAESMWDAYRPLYGAVWPENSDNPPVFDSISNKTIAVNSTLSFSIHATSASGATITYSARNLPSGATFSGSAFKWTPTSSQAGSYSVTFIASAGSLQATKTVTITVTGANQAPIFTNIVDKSVHALSLLTFTLSATDPDGDTVTYSASGLPSGARLSGSTFTWTPTTYQLGVYTVTFIASDGKLQSSQKVAITVTGANKPPVVGPVSNQTVIAGSLLTFSVPMSDPDGDPLLRAAINLPSGATFSSGTFRWTPTSSQVGGYKVTFYANDGLATTTIYVSITVTTDISKTSLITVIIDNGSANTSSTGGWGQSDAPNPYGGKSVWGYNGDTYSWSFIPTTTARYDLSMWWTSLSTRSSRVPVRIEYSGGTATAYVNQQQNGGKWNLLGTYLIYAGTTCTVTIIAPDGSPPSTCADAVKFEQQ